MKSHIRQLIAEVKERQPLWDRNHELRHERPLIEALWNEVTVLLGLPHRTVKTKWKTLKDTFRKEAKRAANDPTYKPTWSYYSDLKFLYPQLKIDSMENANENDISTPTIKECKIEFVYENVEMHEDDDTASSTSTGIKCELEESILESSSTSDRAKTDENYSEDDDMCFFKSLLPHMKQLSAQKKMLMQMKIQEIVYKEVYSSDLDNL